MNRINTHKQRGKTAIFLFFAFLSLAVMAQSGGKRINLHAENISLKEAFMEIERQTGYSVAYERAHLDADRRLSVSLRDAGIDTALTQLLSGTSCTYRIKGYHVIISRLPDHGKPAGKKPRALTQTVRGIVTDAATNAPIEYATVRIGEGGFLGATTNSSGRFRIDNVPVGRHDLQTDFVGYHTMSTQVIGNSDFYNGAFPAEYGNALSGIFDMHLRNGNNRKHEHTFQLGLMGIDIASEGPISRKRGSSYIFNYRFSTTSLATSNDINLKYQDFAFKLNFPTRRAGTFSLWGIGLIDRNKAEAKERSQWETDGDRQSGKNQLDKAAGGVTGTLPFPSSTTRIFIWRGYW